MAWCSEEQSHRVCPGHWCSCDCKGTRCRLIHRSLLLSLPACQRTLGRNAEHLVGCRSKSLAFGCHTRPSTEPHHLQGDCAKAGPGMQALWAPAPRVKAHCSAAWETYCLPSHCWLESGPAVQLFREGCRAHPPPPWSPAPPLHFGPYLV